MHDLDELGVSRELVRSMLERSNRNYDEIEQLDAERKKQERNERRRSRNSKRQTEAKQDRAVIQPSEQVKPSKVRDLAPSDPPSTFQSKYTVIDLFAGCGGLSLGLEQAGFRPLLFSEVNRHAAETYMANRSDAEIIPVGDIYNLTDQDLELHKLYWKYKGIEDVDLVCGGPPCQGYSGIGHRRTFKLEKKDIPSNHLFQEMARVIRFIRPKVFLFENVRGLLNARWTPAGQKGEIFRDVLSEFKQIAGYTIRWELLHAKDFGVPQNRPRIILIGIRNDVLPSTLTKHFLHHSADVPCGVESGFLPKPDGTPPNLVDLLSDLEDPEYLSVGETKKYLVDPQNGIQRLLRTTRNGKILKKGELLTEQEYSKHSDFIREKFAFMIQNNGDIPERFRTKKFAQRVFPIKWTDQGPNITVTSLPEDYVHYRQFRGPTVREWARIQTFPDWYLFKGPRTTGGRRRAGDPDAGIWDRDVPKYTQIGNAVPVELARRIGEHLVSILRGDDLK